MRLKSFIALVFIFILSLANFDINLGNAATTNGIIIKTSKKEYQEWETISVNVTNQYKNDINGYLVFKSPTKTCPSGKICVTDPVNHSFKVKVNLKANKTTKITAKSPKQNRSGGFYVQVVSNGKIYGKPVGISIIKPVILPDGGIEFKTDKQKYNIGETVTVSITNESNYTITTLRTIGSTSGGCVIPEGCGSGNVRMYTLPIKENLTIKPKQTINLTYTASSVASYELKLSFQNYGYYYMLYTRYLVFDESQMPNNAETNIK
ncbi:hypothetical protein [Gottfriedia solisilvae]|uniref:Uncharacterized protein n=1 Tax=Gottfriedia solisilvae TaxID=1516104 RepID=A0A8J3AWG3_9BACI|nr:hypothetical protein [Gottfriedia solisilvae]GGI17861.1 hypothetical protein GCM10007380_40050 [Gottfriedia solisilvae]